MEEREGADAPREFPLFAFREREMATDARTFRLRSPDGDGEGAGWMLPDDMERRLEALAATGEATRHVCDDGRVLYEIRSFSTPTLPSPLEGEGKGGGGSPLLAEIIRSF